METSGLNHVILTVSDIPRARWFYGTLLEFWLHNLQDGSYFACGGIELFFFPSTKPLADDRLSKFRIGLDHLAFAAPSVRLPSIGTSPHSLRISAMS